MSLHFFTQLLAGVTLLLVDETSSDRVGNWSGLYLQSAQEFLEQLESANRLINIDLGKRNITCNKIEFQQLEKNVKNVTIRVLARPTIPFLLLRGYTGQPNDSLKLTGFVGEIWNILEENLKFKTEIILRPRNQNSNWDLVLNPKEWYSRKMDHYDYTIPIAESWYLLFTKGMPSGQANSTFYFRVLSEDFWFVMIVGLILLSTYLWAIWRIREELIDDLDNRKELEDTKYSTCLISVLGTFINQGSQFRDAKASPIRFVTVACILLGYITTNSYSALLISKLAIAPKYSSKAIFLDELLENPAGKTLCVPSTSAAYKMLIDVENNKTIKNSTINLNQPPCSNTDQGFVPLQDYCADNTVVLDTANNLMNAIFSKPNQYLTCPVLVHPVKYFSSNLVLVARKGFPHLRIINNRLRILEESGVLKKIRDKWLLDLDSPSNELGQSMNQPITVQFGHTRTIFYSYLITMSFSFMLFGIELIHTRIKGIQKLKRLNDEK